MNLRGLLIAAPDGGRRGAQRDCGWSWKIVRADPFVQGFDQPGLAGRQELGERMEVMPKGLAEPQRGHEIDADHGAGRDPQLAT